MKGIRCGRGLGDSVYLESVCRHLIETRGEHLRVASDWPDVFLPLGDSVQVVPFTRCGIDILAHYARRKGEPNTTQFRDCCIGAGISEPVELRLDWPSATGALVEDLRARAERAGKALVMVGLPRAPMGRTDGFGMELLPRREAMQAVIDRLRPRCYLVQVGAGETLYRLHGLDADLANRTSVRELIDVCSVAAGMVGYVSFLLALAEALHKPALMVWARAGLVARDVYLRQITPQKIIEHRATTRVVHDDDALPDIEGVADAFLQ